MICVLVLVVCVMASCDRESFDGLRDRQAISRCLIELLLLLGMTLVCEYLSFLSFAIPLVGLLLLFQFFVGF